MIWHKASTMPQQQRCHDASAAQFSPVSPRYQKKAVEREPPISLWLSGTEGRIRARWQTTGDDENECA
jgi:hypothetical protein